VSACGCYVLLISVGAVTPEFECLLQNLESLLQVLLGLLVQMAQTCVDNFLEVAFVATRKLVLGRLWLPPIETGASRIWWHL
jgi:hypothetical protein